MHARTCTHTQDATFRTSGNAPFISKHGHACLVVLWITPVIYGYQQFQKSSCPHNLNHGCFQNEISKTFELWTSIIDYGIVHGITRHVTCFKVFALSTLNNSVQRNLPSLLLLQLVYQVLNPADMSYTSLDEFLHVGINSISLVIAHGGFHPQKPITRLKSNSNKRSPNEHLPSHITYQSWSM